MSSPPTQEHFPYTLAIFKPDISTNTDAVVEVMTQMMIEGLEIGNEDCKITRLPREIAEQLYAEHKGKPFYEGLIDFMTSGTVYVFALGFHPGVLRRGAIRSPVLSWRSVVASVCREYATPGGPRNALHGSDSEESARREIALFFTSPGSPDELRPEVKSSSLNAPVSA